MLAYACYRGGKYAEAGSLLSTAAMGGRYGTTIMLTFRAMTKARLKDREAAMGLLSMARDAYKKAMLDDGTKNGDYGEQWWDRLSAEALLAEAENLIAGTDAKLAQGDLPLNQSVDLLPQVDLERDTTNGTWTKNGATVANTSPNSCVMLPVKVQGEYDLRVTFTRQEGDDILIELPVGSHACDLFFGCWKGTVHGLGMIDGKNADNNPTTKRPGNLVNGKQYTVQVKVRFPNQAASIEVLLNDERIIQWQGKEASLAAWAQHTVSTSQQVGLLVHDTKVKFQAVQLRMISGKASWTTSAKPPGPIFPPGPQHEREVAEWALSAGRGLDIETGDGAVQKNVKSLPSEPFWVSFLWLNKSEIQDCDVKRLRGLERLKGIDLGYSRTTDETLKLLCELPSLERVSLFSRIH